jgi:hypothetical protein
MKPQFTSVTQEFPIDYFGIAANPAIRALREAKTRQERKQAARSLLKIATASNSLLISPELATTPIITLGAGLSGQEIILFTYYKDTAYVA